MFYINRQMFRKRETLFLRFLPTAIVFVAFIALTFVSWATAKNNLRQEQQRILEQSNTNTAAFINQRLDTYEDVLRGAVGLFNASSGVTRNEWNAYFSSYDIADNYPGIQSIGYIEYVPGSKRQAFVNRVKQEGLTQFKIYPETSGDVAVVTYIEPYNPEVTTILGFNMYSEATRRHSLEEARDTGRIVLTDLLTLTSDVSKPDRQPGLLIFMPIYNNALLTDTLEERRANIKGFAYLPFRTYDMINRIVFDQNQNYGFTIENLAEAGRQTVYESENYGQLAASNSSLSSTTTIELSNTKWELTGVVSQSIVSSPLRRRPQSIIWAGIIFSMIVAGFIYLLLTSRARALSEKEERNIQEAKDELLALASHQLRTPATGVKQYIGMLREGFAGDVSKLQRKLLNKAYESNERQLATINEMLFVARADAGHLKMDEDLINLNTLVKDVVDEQRGSIASRHQTIKVKIPHSQIYISGSHRYIRMIVENILSNATKYTHHDGEIGVSLRRRKTKAVIKVTDTGVGIAPKDFNLLFKKFSRIPNELTDEVVGTGIGLYLSKKLIEAHKGTIEFESSPGKGSVVTITLPQYTE